MNYNIVRSKRKNITICINRNAQLVIKAPLKISSKKIDEFVQKHSDWITKNMQKVHARLHLYTPYTALENELVLVLGHQCTIKYTDSNSHTHTDILYLHKSNNPLQSLISFYKTLANEVVIERAKRFANSINIKGAMFKLSSAKTSWGTCNSSGTIRLGWRLVLLDASLIDYVILHELCHLREHNHSKNFWKLVEVYMPDYKARRQKLKEFSHVPYII